MNWDRRNGKGKLRNSKGDLISGTFYNGTINGPVKMKTHQGFLYMGEFKDN